LQRRDILTAESFKEILDELLINVNYTTSLLENLLTWLRTRCMGTKVNPKNFDLGQLVKFKYSAIKRNCRNKEIKLKNSIAEGTYVFADTDMAEIAKAGKMLEAAPVQKK